ncbi:MAG: MerR family transcriptional regulator [Candidatus Humimicrobiaceae bacterium]
MLSIGMFSKINRITVKTLRHYDETGLIKPCRVDKKTGYRYYSTEQLPRMHRIISFKQMGLTLDEIKIILNNESSIKEVLSKRADEVKINLCSEMSKLSQIQNYLGTLEGELVKMGYDVIIKQLPEVTIASMRQTVPDYNAFFDLCPNIMGREMQRLGCICAVPEYCFNIYHDGEYKDVNFDVEICQAVTKMKEDSEILKFKKIKEVPYAACALHKGPYQKIGIAYGHILKWIEENHYELADNPRESYIDGIWNKESEEDWLTEVQIPIRK